MKPLWRYDAFEIEWKNPEAEREGGEDGTIRMEGRSLTV